MPSITMQGEVFGRAAGEAILRNATTEGEFMRLVAAFKVFLEASVALKRREEGEETASAFEQAARSALASCIALYAEQSHLCPQPLYWDMVQT